MGEVPSVEEMSKTQEWSRECHGRAWTLRKKNFFSEAKLGKMAWSGTGWTVSWGLFGEWILLPPHMTISYGAKRGLKDGTEVSLYLSCTCFSYWTPAHVLWAYTTSSVETEPQSRNEQDSLHLSKNNTVELVPYGRGRKARDGDSITYSCIHTYFQGTGLSAGDNNNNNNNKVMIVCGRTVSVASLD